MLVRNVFLVADGSTVAFSEAAFSNPYTVANAGNEIIAGMKSYLMGGNQDYKSFKVSSCW